jgi:2',3'-cyclic-nucleotide 2'-phosphodiesterase (5'-nucleotidase family)
LINSKTTHIILIKNIFFPLVVLSLIGACSSKKAYVKAENNSIEVTYFETDPVADSILSPYKKVVRATMDAIINTAPRAMMKGQPESELGNFISDLSREIAKKNNPELPIDICVFNTGGLRAPLPAGNITKGNVYELMPFENELVVVTIKGNKINEFADYIAGSGGQPVSGIKLGIKDKKPFNFLINNMPPDTNRTYNILTSDYLSQGGDKMKFFNDPIAIKNLSIKMRDVIMDYIIQLKAENKLVESKKDGRVYNE